MRLQHVSIPYHPGQEARAKAFYGGLLGLAELTPPEALTHVLWYALGGAELHLFLEKPYLFLEEDALAPTRQHLCLEIEDPEALLALRARLEAAGVATEDTTPIPGRPRFFCRDPFGNRLECTAVTGDYR